MLKKVYFLAPHDRDYLALKLFFKEDEAIKILDTGANIGQSSVGLKKFFQILLFMQLKVIQN